MASKRKVRQRECGNKRRHASSAAALAEMKRLDQSVGRLHVYRCRWCSHYHVGHMPARNLAQMRLKHG